MSMERAREYSSLVDQAVDSGNWLARHQLPSAAILQLRDMPGHHINHPWSVHSTPRHLIFPSTQEDVRVRVVTASSVTTDNEWVTYYWTGNTWVQVATAPDDRRVILTCALLNENRALKRELSGLKVERMNMESQLTTLAVNHAASRATRASRRSGCCWFFALLVLLLSFLPSITALETSSTTRSRDPEDLVRRNNELNSFIMQVLDNNYTRSYTDYVVDHHTTVALDLLDRWHIYMNGFKALDWHFLESTRTPAQRLLLSILRNVTPWAWEVVTVGLAVAILVAENPSPWSILYLACATFTGLRFAMLAIAPFQTQYSTIVALVMSFFYCLDPLVAVTCLVIHLFVFSLVGLFLKDLDYIMNVRASFLTLLAFTGHGLCTLFGVSTGPVTTLVVLWRIWRLLSITTTSGSVEVRSEEGKVVSKTPVQPNFLFRFKQALQRMRQVRSVQTPLARVNPDALCHVSVSGAKGTGFFCANYVITAAHVVGKETAVNVCYKGRNYQTTVKKILEKDVALLNLPPGLTPPRLKISRKHCCDWICVCAPDGDGAYLTAVTEGHEHNGHYSYACPTRDGMSGAPVLDTDGHVLGVHSNNTGYTGGAVRLDLEDVVEPPKPNAKTLALENEVEELKKQIALLQNPPAAQPVTDQAPLAPETAPQPTKAALEQSFHPSEIVNLIRAAVGREMQIVRDELNEMKQAKGKTKHGRGRKHNLVAKAAGKKRQRGPVFTEEEYKEMLDSGIDAEEIRRMAEDMWEDVAGFPEWSDPEFSDDEGWEPTKDDGWIDFDHETHLEGAILGPWKQKKTNPLSSYLKKIFDRGCVEEMLESVCPLEQKLCGHALAKVKDAKTPEELSLAIGMLDRTAVAHGLQPFSEDLDYTQAKNGKRPRKGAKSQDSKTGNN